MQTRNISPRIQPPTVHFEPLSIRRARRRGIRFPVWTFRIDLIDLRHDCGVKQDDSRAYVQAICVSRIIARLENAVCETDYHSRVPGYGCAERLRVDAHLHAFVEGLGVVEPLIVALEMWIPVKVSYVCLDHLPAVRCVLHAVNAREGVGGKILVRTCFVEAFHFAPLDEGGVPVGVWFEEIDGRAAVLHVADVVRVYPEDAETSFAGSPEP